MKTCVNTKNLDTMSSSTVRTAVDQIHESLVVVSFDKAANNVVLIFKSFYASVITKELGLGNNNNASTYKEIILSYIHIANKK